MPNLLPVFSSHYSLGDSILTLEDAGKSESGGPVSIIDLAREHHLKQVVLVDHRIDGFLEAYKNLSKSFKPSSPKSLDDYLREEQGDKKKPSDEDRQKAQAALDKAVAKQARESQWLAEPIQLVYGLKLCVIPDMANKEQESARQESNIIIFLKNTQAYNDVLRIWNRAWVDGHFTPARESGHGRIDWTTLKTLWTPNLSLALPWASSFLARNMMTFASIVPDLPVPANEVTLFKEVDSGLPFASLLDDAVDRFATDTGASIQPTKSVYYEDGERDFDTYVTYRAILNHGTWGAPEVPHLCSDRFSFTDFLRLSKGGQS